MKKLAKGLLTLTMAMGITTSVHADGWLRVNPIPVEKKGNPITSIVATTNVTIPNVANNGCGGTPISFDPNEFHYAEAYSTAVLLLNRASIEDRDLDIWINCVGTDARGSAIILDQ